MCGRGGCRAMVLNATFNTISVTSNYHTIKTTTVSKIIGLIVCLCEQIIKKA